MLDRAVRLRRSHPPTLATVLSLAALLVLLLAACQPVHPVPDSGAAAPAAEMPAAFAGGIMVSQNDTLGDFLVDAKGMTLYLFTKDEPGVSNCYDQCAEHWPPLLTEGDAMAGSGADAALLGTTDRTDGTVQVTYNGWPLYYWWEDVAPGDTAGQTVGDVWYVVSLTGEAVK